MDGHSDPSNGAETMPAIEAEELLQAMVHSGGPTMDVRQSEVRQIEHAGKLDYTYDPSLEPERDPDVPWFEAAEHIHLGNLLKLQWSDKSTVPARKTPLKLENGLKVTYGQINALAGDFFAFKEPICLGTDLKQQEERFNAGFASLSADPSGKKYAEGVIGDWAEEVQALEDGKSAEYYNTLKAKHWNNLVAAARSLIQNNQEKGYAGLALVNFDHFGKDARTAYNAAHSAALRKAATEKTARSLELAYAMNAFADHYLEDSFSAGHLRVPRQKLHGGTLHAKDKCAHFMHGEDNEAGLRVSNPNGKSWVSYGDGKLLEKVDQDNVTHCFNALTVSVNEVFEAWSTGKVPLPETFGAWKHAPILEKLDYPADKENHPPMFNKSGLPRTAILDTTCKTYAAKETTVMYEAAVAQLLAGPKLGGLIGWLLG